MKCIMEFYDINVNTPADLLSIRDSWTELQKGQDMTVFQSFEWNCLLTERWLADPLHRNCSQIHILYVSDNNRVRLIIPVIHQKTVNIFRRIKGNRDKGIYILGYDTYPDYLNLIYDDTDDVMLDFAFSEIRKRYMYIPIFWDYILSNTVFGRWCEAHADFYFDKISVSIHIPDSKSEYDAKLSKNTRQNIRTAKNRIEKDKRDYRAFIYEKTDDRELLNKLNSMYLKRARTKNKTLDEFLHFIHTCLREKNYNIIEQSMMRMEESFLMLVCIDGETAGYLYGLKDRKAIRIMRNCFDMKYAYYSPMTTAIYDYVIKLIQERSFTELDFTRGTEEYKLKMGGEKTRLISYVNAPSPMTGLYADSFI